MSGYPQALIVGLALLACGSPPPPAAAAPPEPPPDPEAELQREVELDDPAPSQRLPVLAGAYRLRMTAACPQQERSAKGRLTLKRISAADLPGGAGGAEVDPGQRLLWGQTDLDVESLEACLGPLPDATAKREPIHPNLLMEVLQWNGQSQRQVLLVAAEPKKRKGRRSGAAGGVAMWVEQADEKHLAGVWCRWEVMNAGEGRWEADLERAESQ